MTGFDTIESDKVGKNGDCLYFDEECFLRGRSSRFQLDSIIPISGKAVSVGTSDGGNVLRDAATNTGSQPVRLQQRRKDK